MLKLMWRPKTILMNLKISEEDLLAIKVKANYYTKGNVSMWMRYAALNHRPKKADLMTTKKGKENGESKEDYKKSSEEVYEGKSI